MAGTASAKAQMAKPKQRIQVIGDDSLSFNLFRERKLDVIYWPSGKPSKNAAAIPFVSGKMTAYKCPMMIGEEEIFLTKPANGTQIQ